MRPIAACALLLVTLSALGGRPRCAAGQEAAAPGRTPTAEDVALWVSQLDSDQFVVREAATTRLIQAGAAAIEPVAAIVPAGSLEVVLRGIHVLRELALASDPDCQDAARNALERIASARLTNAARRAELTLASLNEARQARAIEELQKLGAKLTTSHVQFGFQVVENVTVLEIGGDWRGEVKDLRRLKYLGGIQHVKFSGPKVTDEWMGFIAGMENLTNLSLKRTEVTAEGLAHIRNLQRLQVVWLMYSPIGDQAVEHLLALKQVNQLKLYGTQISREAAKKLADELVGAKIDHRQGAFLGVNCQAHPLGCEVVLVQPNTAAATAGLQSNDVVLKYAGERVDNFEALTALISKNRPGDEVKVELVRDPRLRRAPFVHKPDEPLGATTKAHVLGCEITEVKAESLAERLELKPGDVIVGYKEKRTPDPASLKAAFEDVPPGENASLDYVRQPEVLQRVVVLGEWD